MIQGNQSINGEKLIETQLSEVLDISCFFIHLHGALDADILMNALEMLMMSGIFILETRTNKLF